MLHPDFLLFLQTSMGRNIYKDIPPIEDYVEYLCLISNKLNDANV